MAISITIDNLQDVSSEEDNGTIVALTRTCQVLEATSQSLAIHNEVYTAMDGLSPSLAYGTTPTGYGNLVLVGRSFRCNPDSNTQGMATLRYQSFGRAQLEWTIRGGSALRQITSRVDRLGFAIVVSHGGVSQGGEIDVDYPQTVITASAYLQEEAPWVRAHLHEARLNRKRWGGAPPGTVMVSSVNFEPHDMSTSPPTWYFTYELTFDLTGWQPEVYYVDPATGRPPSNLVSGVGFKRVGWYPTIDFTAEIFELEL